MYVATTAFSTAARMNSCGIENCSTSSHTMASSAASTMKPAFMMLLHAMMRARWLSATTLQDQCVQRHDEQAAEDADRRAVERDASSRRRQERGP